MDEQKELLHGIWRKAFLDGGLEIPCKTESNASRLRFVLYNSVRGVRRGKEPADATLADAIRNCTIGFKAGDKATLVVQRKVMTEMMQLLTGIVGDSPEVTKTAEEVEAEASAAKVLELVREAEAGETTLPDLGLPRHTPYYDR